MRGVLLMEVWKHLHKLHVDANDTGLILSLKKSSSICYPFVVPHESVIVLMKGQNLTFGVEFINIFNGTAIVVIAWPPKLSVNMVLVSSRATAPLSSQHSGKQSHASVHGRNYQSASQPSNWGIRLNSVKWHFSGGGTRCSRLWIKVIPQQRSSFQSSRRTSDGREMGAVNKTVIETDWGLLLMLLFFCQPGSEWQSGTAHDEWGLSNAPRQYPYKF